MSTVQDVLDGTHVAYYELIDSEHKKFWTVQFEPNNGMVVTTYGRIGNNPSKSRRPMQRTSVAALIQSKIDKGYVLTSYTPVGMPAGTATVTLKEAAAMTAESMREAARIMAPPAEPAQVNPNGAALRRRRYVEGQA